MNARYPSKVDWWLGLLLCALVFLAVAMPVLMAATAGTRQVLVALPGSAIIVLIVGGLVWPMHYELGDDALRIRGGWFLRVSVPYAAITHAEPTSNPLSSPALSLRRIMIHYARPRGGSTFVMISPVDREAFLTELARRTGRHRMDGDRMVENPT